MSPQETYEFCQSILEIESMTAGEISEKFPIGSMVARHNKLGYYKVMGYKQTALGWILIFDTHQDYAFLYYVPDRVCVEQEKYTEDDMMSLRPTVVFDVGGN